MKISPSLIVAIIALAIVFLSSCQQRATEDTAASDSCCVVKVTADSLIGLWNDAWNTKNIEALKAMIDVDAVMLETEWKVEGRDSIMAKWISVNLPVVSNLKTFPVVENNCCCCISLTALYTLDVTSKEGVHAENGNFTFVWNMAEDKTWKLKVIHLDAFDPKN